MKVVAMLGDEKKLDSGDMFHVFNVDELIPPNHLLRRLDAVLDTAFADPEVDVVVGHGAGAKVVNGEKGTARGSRLADIDMSGKTGTSQVVSRKEDEQLEEEDIPVHLRAHAWFVAYAPSENPTIAVAVVVEHGEHGSGAAAPIAREMIKTYLRKPPVGSQVATQNDAGSTGGDG